MFPVASRPSKRASRSPSSSTTRTPRTRWKTSCGLLASSRRAGSSASSARAATAIAGSGRSWAGSRQRARGRRDRHLRQPTQRGAAGDHRRDPRRGRRRDVEVEPDRRAAIEQAVAMARAARRRRDRRQGARAGPGVRGRQEAPVRRPRGRARGPPQGLGSRVIPLAVDELRPLGRLESTADEVTGVKIDSRRIEPGDLFVAVRGGDRLPRPGAGAGRGRDARPGRRLRRTGGDRPRVRDRSDAEVVGDHRLDRQDVDEGHPGRARPPAPAGPSRRRRATTPSSASRSPSRGSNPTPSC